jgi:hypothetical protein
MIAFTGILMSGQAGAYLLEMDLNTIGGASNWRTTFTNATYNRFIDLTGISNDTASMPSNGGTQITAQVQKLSGLTLDAGTVQFFKNAGLVRTKVFNGGEAINEIEVFAGLVPGDTIRIEVQEG